MLHDERMKKAFLKNEGRKTQNLIADFDSNFRDFKYLDGTEDVQAQKLSSGSAKEFMQDNFIYNHMRTLSEFKKENRIMLEEHPDQVDAATSGYERLVSEGSHIDPRQAPEVKKIETNEFDAYKQNTKDYQNIRIG